MPVIGYDPVDFLPVLSRGKHRNARRGACFMEYASHLAGERWSDHPSCTHPALASLARLVNDWTSDPARSRLAVMIPSVIGIVGTDERIDLTIAIRAAAAALPVASEGRQRALAVGLIRCESRAADIDRDAAAPAQAIVRGALEQAPLAERWAVEQLEYLRPREPRTFTPMYDAIVNVAVAGIGEACIEDSDDRLRLLLETATADCELLVARPAPIRETQARLVLT